MTNGDNRDSYYRPVRGSRDLSTRNLADDELDAIENLSGLKEDEPLKPYAGEFLGRAEVEPGAGLSLPKDAFDRLASELTPLEQALFYQMLRLSVGEGKNFCRTGKRDLISRTGISERRLLVALDGLVRKERIRPLHRNNLGTLYRVFMPGEKSEGSQPAELKAAQAQDTKKTAKRPPHRAKKKAAYQKKHEKEEYTYYVDSSSSAAKRSVRAKEERTQARKSDARASLRTRPLESPLNEERFAGMHGSSGPAVTVADIVETFFRGVKVKPTADARDEAVSQVTSLLEDGYTRDEILTAVKWFAGSFPKERTLERLAYHIHQALAEKNP